MLSGVVQSRRAVAQTVKILFARGEPRGGHEAFEVLGRELFLAVRYGLIEVDGAFVRGAAGNLIIAVAVKHLVAGDAAIAVRQGGSAPILKNGVEPVGLQNGFGHILEEKSFVFP